MRYLILIITATVFLSNVNANVQLDNPALSNTFQSHDSIRALARTFLSEQLNESGKNVHISISTLDRRLKLHQCTEALSAFQAPGASLKGNTSVGIRCRDNKPWKLYVPAQVKLYSDVVVTAGYLPRGKNLNTNNLIIASRDVTTLNRGYFTNLNEAIGHIVKFPLQKNSVVTPSSIAKAKLVSRGQTVTIFLETSKGLKVKMFGKALTEGGKGDLIRVRNQKSKKIVEGIVSSSGTISVIL